MNALVGDRLSIVTPRAQTTWKAVTGIHTREGAQVVFLDTPGLLQPKDLLQRSMLAAAVGALRDADVVLVVLDASDPLSVGERERLLEVLNFSRGPRLVAVNKVDVANPFAVQDEVTWAHEALGATAFRVSAVTGEGIAELLDGMEQAVPEGPFLYPEDEIATEPVRFFVAEMVRETVFERYHQEIPYSVAAEVGEYREATDPVYIQITLYVERESQKGILLGKGGSAIRELGKVARGKIEAFLARPVYLDLWVKVLPGWRRGEKQLRRLGFEVPDEDSAGQGV
jgi:GTPase